nr:hypothetical protein [Tanacetum cinerariifolium]
MTALEMVNMRVSYQEAAQQLLEQAPHSPEYVPDPIELEDHVPAYIPDHPEDLLPAEDEAPIEAYIPEVVESSAAAAARQPGPTIAHSVYCSFVDTMETRL